MRTTEQDLTRINNDVNGNPRYVVHFTHLLKEDALYSPTAYQNAVVDAKKAFGGKKFHNKQYGGGIVFQSYNVNQELELINKINGSLK